MIELPLGTLPVDLWPFLAIWRKTRRARSRFSSDNYEVLRGRSKGKRDCISSRKFDNVRFSENYCFAVHKGDAESLTDLVDRYLSMNST